MFVSWRARQSYRMNLTNFLVLVTKNPHFLEWETMKAEFELSTGGEGRRWETSKCSCLKCILAIPKICHGSHGYTRVNFFLAGLNFYRFNAKNWHFWQILRKKVAFFTDLMRKIGVFGCKFYSHKNCVSVKKMTIIRYEFWFILIPDKAK